MVSSPSMSGYTDDTLAIYVYFTKFILKVCQMIIVDAHQDIAYNALGQQRDYRVSALEHRRRENNPAYAATIGLPDALLGRVALVFATLFVEPTGKKQPKTQVDFSYRNAKEAYEKAMIQLDYYHRLADENARIGLVRSASELDNVLATWKEGTEIKDHKQGLVILMEGADPIIEPKQLEEWVERGVRIVGLAWGATRYSGGTGAPGGLTPLGRELLEIMAGFKVLLDLSHAAEKAFLEALDTYSGHLIASHSNPRKFCNSDRHLSDEMILRFAERDGVMGIVLYNRFLSNNWSNGSPKDDVTLATVADAIDYVCQLTGSAAHVGIGSDMDGGFGAASIPAELDTVTDLLKIADVLRSRGYAQPDIEAIMGGNMIRKLRQVL